MHELDAIRDVILVELGPIRDRRAELQSEDAELAEKERRLQRALKELEGDKKKTSKARSKDSKPSVKREHIQPVCLALVKAKPGIARDELAKGAAEKLLEQGFGRNGLTMQIGKCIDSELFVIDREGKVAVSSPSGDPTSINSPNAESRDPQLPVESSR